MEITQNEKNYKTTLLQRISMKKYANNNRDKLNKLYNKFYSTNEEYRLKHIERGKKRGLIITEKRRILKEYNNFLKILLDDVI